MLNEQFTWLTPFIQLECPSFAWRTRGAEKNGLFLENFFLCASAVKKSPRCSSRVLVEVLFPTPCPSQSSSVVPHLARNFSNQPQLPFLYLRTDRIAFGHRGKATLGAEGQAFEWNIASGFCDSGLELINTFLSRVLGCYQTKDDHLVIGHLFEGLEITRSLVVILEEQPFGACSLENHFGNPAIASLGHVTVRIVPATDVQAERDSGMSSNDRVDHLHAVFDQPDRVESFPWTTFWPAPSPSAGST